MYKRQVVKVSPGLVEEKAYKSSVFLLSMWTEVEAGDRADAV